MLQNLIASAGLALILSSAAVVQQTTLPGAPVPFGDDVVESPLAYGTVGGEMLGDLIERAVAPDLETLEGEVFLGTTRSLLDRSRTGEIRLFFADELFFGSISIGDCKSLLSGRYTYAEGVLEVYSVDLALSGPSNVELAPWTHDFQFEATIGAGRCTGERFVAHLRHYPGVIPISAR